MNEIEKGRVGRKVSPLDVFAVLLVILCIAALIARAFIGKEGVIPEGAPETEGFTVRFEVQSQNVSLGNSLSSGDILYAEDGSVFGTVENLRSLPAVIYYENEKGEYASYNAPENGDSSLRDITVTAEAEGYDVDYGYLIGGKTFASPNYEMTLHTETLTLNVRIIDIVKNDR